MSKCSDRLAYCPVKWGIAFVSVDFLGFIALLDCFTRVGAVQLAVVSVVAAHTLTTAHSMSLFLASLDRTCIVCRLLEVLEVDLCVRPRTDKSVGCR